MPMVHVYVWEGFGKDRAKRLIRGITKVFGELGVPEHAVEVVVHEVPKTHWGVGGEPASEKFGDKP
ncbi:MAG: tautomerase family protein [Nitrososphaerota archaeon]|nr:tautomerase family protein [Nitrososphaerota archaeon]